MKFLFIAFLMNIFNDYKEKEPINRKVSTNSLFQKRDRFIEKGNLGKYIKYYSHQIRK